MQEILVQSLHREDPLEKGLANHFSILAWRILWTEQFGGRQSMGLQGVGRTERLTLSLSHSNTYLHRQLDSSYLRARLLLYVSHLLHFLSDTS